MAIIYSIIKNLPSIVAGLAGIAFLIGFHELGHYIFCKIFNVKVPSFSIGFGPEILKKKIGETTFALSAIPLGGYVEIAGIEEVGQGEQKEAKRNDERAFTSKPYYQKFLILMGGIIFNVMIGYIIMIGLFTTGAPKTPLLHADSISPKIGSIVQGSTAAKYELHAGDTITAINGTPVKTSLDLHNQIVEKANKEVTITITRNSKVIEKNITVGATKRGNKEIGQLGIHFAPSFSKPMPFAQAISNGIQATNQMLYRMILQFKALFKSREYQSIGGPVMMISEVANSTKHGLKVFLLLLVVISLNLAILNLIPIPILDGGQILFTTIEAIARRPIPEKVKLSIHYTCWVAFLALTVYLSYKDLFRILK